MPRCMSCSRALVVAVVLSLGGCAADDAGGRRQPGAAQGGAGASGPVTAPVAGTGGGAPGSFGNPQLDGGVLVPMRDPCADGGCTTTEPGKPDDDGFTVAEGDCNDFAELVNPGAFDVPGNGIDEDCEGGDATSDLCDDALELASIDPVAAARAIELCAVADEGSRRWGVISARWTTPDGLGELGSPLMHGLLPGFGPAFSPRAGKALLALSSGVARAPGQQGFTRDCSDNFPIESTGIPKGFDGMSSSCPSESGATSIVDAVALELRVRMPTNATALSFDSAFFTDEYPSYICTPYNDFFQVLVAPERAGGTPDGNVVFDRDGNAVSVNNSLLGACTPGRHGEKDFACPLGFEPLMGTGFEECARGLIGPGGGLFGGLIGGEDQYGASTGWLNTEFAVTPGEILTLRFTIWDSGDGELDSSSLVDHVRFRFRDEPPPPEKPMTMPIGPD